MFTKILLANDGSPGAMKALDMAIELAALTEASVDYCKAGGFDLLVLGFMGHSSVWGRIWGSTSHNLTRLAPCSVFVGK